MDLPKQAYRERALERRLPACLRFLKVATASEAARKIASQPALAPAALSVVLLGVTEFFRDRAVFESLRQRVLPYLLARHSRLRVWSAACSEGQELYSVAMLLEQLHGLAGCELLGTDCRGEAIQHARLGVFGHEQVTRLEPGWRDRYFTFQGRYATIAPVLRDAATWKQANLFGAVEAGPWHLILWRNMAIYLEPERAEDVWERLCEQVATGGFLVTGKADLPPKRLPLTRIAPCVYQKGQDV